MIDYDATLQQFFAECIKFLEKQRSRANDQIALKRINDAISVVSRVAANPKMFRDYDVRVKAGLEPMDLVYAFMPAGTDDNRVYLMYSAVVNSMENLYNEYDWYRAEAQQTLLNSLKAIKYRNTTNILKDFYFPLLSAKKFAIKSEKQR